MYLIVDDAGISLENFKQTSENFCYCVCDSLEELKETVEEAFCKDFNLDNITVFKIERIIPVELKLEIKEVLCEKSQTKKRAPKNDYR